MYVYYKTSIKITNRVTNQLAKAKPKENLVRSQGRLSFNTFKPKLKDCESRYAFLSPKFYYLQMQKSTNKDLTPMNLATLCALTANY